jgi:hypothetical protein
MKKFVIFFLMLSGCNFVDDYYYAVDPLVESHVDKFYEEANARGIDLDRTNLTVIVTPHFKKFESGAGMAIQEGGQRFVYLWDEVVEYYMEDCPECVENLVFHELGHSLLRKEHKTDTLNIMGISTSFHVYEGKPELREQLLNQLFTNE